MKKIIICYPPLTLTKGCPTLGQNRQFQYFKEPTYIYPIVPAQAATLLKQAGYDVMWLDCIAQGITDERFLEIIRRQKPDIIAFETKTPVVKQHWKIINDIKRQFPSGRVPLTVLFGDHVTALPEESFQNSRVDFILTGGDYDFLLLNLCNTLNELPITHYQLPITKLEPGIYYRDNDQIKNTGKFQLHWDLMKWLMVNHKKLIQGRLANFQHF
ncbi:MAG: cobalamin B12-binding domain-containing protein [Candidatus Omnitrophica bacterium]|nr:cobalamin B12-binding domain-containing protein [Candidatus Omnitrophota bacterium]